MNEVKAKLYVKVVVWLYKNIMFCLFQTPANIKKVEILNLSKCFVPWSLSTRITCYNSLCVDFCTNDAISYSCAVIFTVAALLVFCSFAYVL